MLLSVLVTVFLFETIAYGLGVERIRHRRCNKGPFPIPGYIWLQFCGNPGEYKEFFFQMKLLTPRGL